MFIINEEEVLDLCRKASLAFQSFMLKQGFAVTRDNVRIYIPSNQSSETLYQLIIGELFKSENQQDYLNRYHAWDLVIAGMEKAQKMPDAILDEKGNKVLSNTVSLNNDKFKLWLEVSFREALKNQQSCRAFFNQMTHKNKVSEAELNAVEVSASPSKTKVNP